MISPIRIDASGGVRPEDPVLDLCTRTDDAIEEGIRQLQEEQALDPKAVLFPGIFGGIGKD